MDEFVSKKLKELGKDYFLTEFVVNNPTNSTINFDLFDSNSSTNVPTSPLPPTIQGNVYSFAGNAYSMAINSSNNTLYVVNGTNNVLVFNLSNNALINTLIGGATDQYSSITYNSTNNTMLITASGLDTAIPASASLVGVVVLNCNTNIFTPYPLPSGLGIIQFFGNYIVPYGYQSIPYINYNSVLNNSNQTLYIPTQSNNSPIRYLTKFNAQTNTFSGNITLGNIPSPNTFSDINSPIYGSGVDAKGGVIISNGLLYVFSGNASANFSVFSNDNGVWKEINSFFSPSTIQLGSIFLWQSQLSYSPVNNTIYFLADRIFAGGTNKENQVFRFDCSTNAYSNLFVNSNNLIPNNLEYNLSTYAFSNINPLAITFCPSINRLWSGYTDVSLGVNFLNIKQYGFPSNPTNITTINYGVNTISDIVFNSVTNNVYISQLGKINVRNALTGADITTVNTAPSGGSVFSGQLRPIGLGEVYLAGDTVVPIVPDVIRVFDCATNTFFPPITVGVGVNLRNIQYANERIYGTCQANTVFVYDIGTATFTYITIPQQGNLLTFNSTDLKIYVSSFSTNEIYVIDWTTNTFVNTISTSGIVKGSMTYDSIHNVFYYIINFSGTDLVVGCNCSFNINFYNSSLSNPTYTISQIIFVDSALDIDNQNKLYYSFKSGTSFAAVGVGDNSLIINFQYPIYNTVNNSIYSIYQSYDFIAGNYYNAYYISKIDCATNVATNHWLGISSLSLMPSFSFALSRQGVNPIAFNPTLNYLYIPNVSSIKVFDCNTNTPLTDLTPPVSSNSGDIQIATYANNKVYFIYGQFGGNGLLFSFDCNTNLFSSVTDLGADVVPISTAFNNTDNLLYFYNYNINSGITYLLTINLNNNSITSVIITTTDFPNLVYAQSNNLVWRVSWNYGVSSYYNQNGQFATYCPNNNCIYLGSNNNSNQVTVVNCSTETIVATITTNNFPIQCAYNSATNEMYVTCSTGFVDVINCNTNTIVASLSIPSSSPYSIAYNSQLNLMYATDIANSSVINIDCSN